MKKPTGPDDILLHAAEKEISTAHIIYIIKNINKCQP
jgi:hypothetical protein